MSLSPAAMMMMMMMTVGVARSLWLSCRNIVADCDVKGRTTSPSATQSTRFIHNDCVLVACLPPPRGSVLPGICSSLSLFGCLLKTPRKNHRAFSFHFSPRTEDCSVPDVIPWCDLTMYCALSARLSLSADLSPCTGCYKLILLTLYGGPAAAVR